MIVLRNARIVPELVPGYDDDKADIVIEGNRIVEILQPQTGFWR